MQGASRSSVSRRSGNPWVAVLGIRRRGNARKNRLWRRGLGVQGFEENHYKPRKQTTKVHRGAVNLHTHTCTFFATCPLLYASWRHLVNAHMEQTPMIHLIRLTTVPPTRSFGYSNDCPNRIRLWNKNCELRESPEDWPSLTVS